jgi:GT2 family glycosyltransferase
MRSSVSRLAIVIRAVGNNELLEATLVSVLENRPADCQVIVALNGPYSDPYELKDEVRFVEAPRGGSSVAAINRALAATRAPFVHLLASGCAVTEGWADEALSRFGDRQVACVAPLVIDAANHERVLATGVGYRPSGRRYLAGGGLDPASSEASVVGPCGFAAFYRKTALDFVGGLSTQLGSRQVDVDLGLVLRRAGFSVALEPGSRIFACDQVDQGSGSFREALYDERLFWRNLPRSGRVGAIAAHVGAVTVELLASFGRPRMFAQLAARAMACAQFSAHARHRRALDQLGRHALQPKAPHKHVRIDHPHGAAARTKQPAAAQFQSR